MSQPLNVAEQAFASDTGRHRNANEDSYLVSPPVFLVADGMGGAQAGEVASHTAAEAFRPELPDGRPEEILRERIERSNAEIHRRANEDPDLAGMGTTLTAAVVAASSGEVVLGHVGDSRAYRLRGGRLEQLTRDHSLVEEMRRKGQITDEQAKTHPQRSIITRALGPEPSVDVDVQTVSAQDGDVYLLCSDGLTTMVGNDRIAERLESAESLRAAVDALIADANEAGGRDNITVGAFRVATGGDAAAKETSQATLIGPTARDAGLSAEALRAAAGGRGEKPSGASGGSGIRTGARRGLKALVALALVGAVAFGAWWGARQVWFLSPDEGGRVALYQGLPYELPFGIELYGERYSIPVQADRLPETRRESVTGHEMRSRDDAVSLIEDILEASPPRR